MIVIDKPCPHCGQGYSPLVPVTPSLRQCVPCGGVTPRTKEASNARVS